MKSIIKISVISFCVLALIAVPGFYFLTLNKDLSPNVNGKSVEGEGFSMPIRSVEQRREFFKQWAKEQEYFASAEEARKVVPFDFRLPKSELCGEFKGIYYVKQGPPELWWLYVPYNDEVTGICLWIEQRPDPPNCERYIKQLEQDMRSGIFKGDKLPVLVKVNGLSGIGAEPGYNVVHEMKEPRPGFVSWWENGIIYTLFGTEGEGGTPLGQLLEIANSMY
ncbi:MAG: hypothetical protein AB1330_09925 [Bacillota bacterium]